jgi:hypothetical protein
VLAGLLAGALSRSGWPVPAALVLLGLLALGIALLGDLPAVHRAGVVGTPATGLRDAHTVAGAALYLETLGAIALLAGGAVGLTLGAPLRTRPRSQTTPTTAKRPVPDRRDDPGV